MSRKTDQEASEATRIDTPRPASGSPDLGMRGDTVEDVVFAGQRPSRPAWDGPEKLGRPDDAAGPRPDRADTAGPEAARDTQPQPASPYASTLPVTLETVTDGFAEHLTTRSLQVGTVIGQRFHLTRKLGEGSMGQVFLAQNVAIGLEVAIKVLKPDLLANKDFRRRFEKEARAIASVEHANVARFFDLVVGDPTFLVMEFVRGETLQSVMRREHRLDLARAVRLAIGICWGLEAAHLKGILHRDIKPSNIILTKDPREGELAKIIDFGLAKMADHDASALTQAGAILGTPEYMSPEQVTGTDVDARSDVYAVASVLFEMATGRPPFQSASGFSAMFKKVNEKQPSLRAIRTDAPLQLEGVINRALSRSAESRFASAAEFAKTLSQVLVLLEDGLERTGRIRAPRRTGPSPSAGGGLWPHRWAALAIFASLILLALGGQQALSAYRRRGAGPEPKNLLVVSTSPAGARVELDGKPIEEPTPVALTGLAPGEHTVRLRYAGRDDVERQLFVGSKDRTELSVSLLPKSSRREVRTVPSGASVYLDGAVVSLDTPAFVTLTEDDFHELRVEKLGYEPLVKAITPEDRSPAFMLTLEPERKARGLVMVDSDGLGEVWIDGATTGFVTPTMGIHVAVGKHRIELHDPAGQVMSTRMVTVRQGETLRLQLPMGRRK